MLSILVQALTCSPNEQIIITRLFAYAHFSFLKSRDGLQWTGRCSGNSLHCICEPLGLNLCLATGQVLRAVPQSLHPNPRTVRPSGKDRFLP
jgi:hypothetical protein